MVFVGKDMNSPSYMQKIVEVFYASARRGVLPMSSVSCFAIFVILFLLISLFHNSIIP